MSKTLLFNQGGQPIYLDDLKVIQDYCTEQIRALVFALTGSEDGVYLLRPFRTHLLPGTNTAVYDDVDNFLYRDGELIRIVVVSDIVSNNNVVSVTEMAETLRTMKDGTQKSCVMERYALIRSVASPVAGKDYKITELDVLSEMGCGTWEELDVEWTAGYSGTIRRLKTISYDRLWITAVSTVDYPLSSDTLIAKVKSKIDVSEIPVKLFPVTDDRLAYLRLEPANNEALLTANMHLAVLENKGFTPSSSEIDIIIDVPKR